MIDRILLKRLFTTDGPQGRVVAKAVLHRLGEQKPYFSITTDSGAAHDTILAAFSGNEDVGDDVRFLVSMHLCDEDGAAMHAVANAAFHLHEKIVDADMRTKKYALIRDILRITDGELADLLVRVHGFDYEKTKGAVDLFVAERSLRARWKEDAERAVSLLEQPDYVDPKIVGRVYDPFGDTLIRVDGETMSAVCHGDNLVEAGPDLRFHVFEERQAAGKAARDYWRWMADNDQSEFACLVGEATLVAWALGKSAGPGGTKVSSLGEWLDLWLSTPAEHWASYDGEEREGLVSVQLAEDLGFDASDHLDGWVEAVFYRC